MDLTKDLVAASATPLVLSILRVEETYGYELIKRVKKLSAGDIEWSEGMLYPVLHRLEKQAMITSSWWKTDGGRRRKYYRISAKGETELLRLKDQWQTVNKALNRSWKNLRRQWTISIPVLGGGELNV